MDAEARKQELLGLLQKPEVMARIKKLQEDHDSLKRVVDLLAEMNGGKGRGSEVAAAAATPAAAAVARPGPQEVPSPSGPSGSSGAASPGTRTPPLPRSLDGRF